MFEEIKGTDTLKTYQSLKKLSNEDNFIFNGYIEGNELMDGKTNVIVTDGFTGNIALKTAEGTKVSSDSLKKSLTENLFTKYPQYFLIFHLRNLNQNYPRKTWSHFLV